MGKINNTISVSRPITNNQSGDYLLQKLCVHKQNGFRLIVLNDIVRLEALKNYTLIKLVSGEKIVVSKSLMHFEKNLSSYWFLRVHKSHIVNVKYVQEYVCEQGAHALISSDGRVSISRDKVTFFLDAIYNFTNGLRT